MARTFALPAALMVAAVVAASAQTSTGDATITGCLQRAPSTLADEGRFMLMNAGVSPLGGSAASDATPLSPPARGPEPTERRPGQSDARQETGGVSYLLEGNAVSDSNVGQRVEITGTIAGQVRVQPTRPSAARPMQIVRVKRVRAIAPSCSPK